MYLSGAGRDQLHRVLEDRTLLRSLASEGERMTPKRKQLYEVSRYVWWNAARMVF